MTPISLLVGVIALALGAPVVAAAQAGQTPAEMGAIDSTDAPVAAAAQQSMDGEMNEDPHLRLTPRHTGGAADSARALQLVSAMRRDLDKYRDVQVAQADGFRLFLPGVKQPVYHFSNWRWAVEAMFRFDPARPTSHLYEQTPDGRYQIKAFASDDPAVIWAAGHHH